MSNLRFEPITVEHLNALGQFDRAENYYRVNGIGFTLLDDDIPIATGGVMLLWPGVGKAWTLGVQTITSPYILRRIHRQILEQLPIVKRVLNLERIEAEALVGQDKHCEWLKAFGFEFEGIMRKYFAGKDFAMYAWVKES